MQYAIIPVKVRSVFQVIIANAAHKPVIIVRPIYLSDEVYLLELIFLLKHCKSCLNRVPLLHGKDRTGGRQVVQGKIRFSPIHCTTGILFNYVELYPSEPKFTAQCVSRFSSAFPLDFIASFEVF